MNPESIKTNNDISVSNVFSEEYEMYINKLASFERAIEISGKQIDFLRTLTAGD